jgi:peptide/nickel transport system permease protein
MRFLLRRVVFYLVAAWVAVTVNFLIPRLVPGNPAETLFQHSTGLQPGALKALEAEFGIGNSGSLLHQYGQYLWNILHGDLGTSFSNFPSPVSSIIGATLPWTLVLVGTATVIAFVLGTALGILAAWRRNGWLDRVLPGLTFLQATPYFFLALLLVDAVATHLHWFPAQRGYDFPPYVPGWNWGFIQNAAYHSVLPAFTIVITTMAGWMLQMRNVMITTIGEDYVLAAQAKGLSSRRVVMAYAARNAILPQLAGFGLALGFVVSGALLMEIVFNYPGVGFELFTSVQADDYPTTQGIFLIIALVVLLANFVMDAVYVLADPRARTRAVA